MNRDERQNLLWRLFLLCSITLFCWFLFADVRTWGYGAPWSGIFQFALLFSALISPVMFLLLRPYSWRQMLLAIFCVTLVSMFGADLFGRAQEWQLIRQHGERPDHDFVVQRWAPFGNSNLGYNSKSGWWGCD